MRLGVTLLCILTVAITGCNRADTVDAPPVGYEVGNRAPVLEGLDSEGQPFRIESGGGTPDVIVFYSSASCGLCRDQLERMQEHLPAYERANASLVAVSLDPPSESRAFLERAGITYPLVSVDSATFAEWVPTGTALGSPRPATYILDGSGVVNFRHIGRNSSDRTSDAGMIAILSELTAP